MVSVNKICHELSNLSYKLNTFSNAQHENSVKDIFHENNIHDIDKTNIILVKNIHDIDKMNVPEDYLRIKHKKIYSKNKEIRPLDYIREFQGKYFYIKQPFGSQSAPDFILCVDGLFIWCECKSGKKVMWNSGLPLNDVLYVFSYKGHRLEENTTTIFFGQDSVAIDEFEERYNKFDRDIKEYARKRYNEEFGDQTNFSYYNRRMLNDNTKYHSPQVRVDFFDKVMRKLNSVALISTNQ